MRPHYSLLAFLCFGCPELPGQAQPTLAGPAITFIQKQTQAVRNQFYIFKGQDSAFNHSFPSGKYGTATLGLNTGCVYIANSLTGCGSVNDSDANGTVLQVGVPRMTDEFAGRYFQEPEQILNGHFVAGYDLSTSTELLFEALSVRSSPNLVFSIGPASTLDYPVSLGASWMPQRLALPSYRNNLNNLLAVTAIGPSELGYILLRNIRVNPVPEYQKAMLGLPLSFLAYGVTPAKTIGYGRVPVPIDQVLMNLATTADASQALLALLKYDAGSESARQVADSLVYALAHDNRGMAIPVVGPNHGLRNAYTGGDLYLHSDQPPLDAKKPEAFGRAGDVRLPGFGLDPTEATCGPSDFCLVLNGASGGANAWAIVALLAASAQFESGTPESTKKYLSAARQIGNWIFGRLRDTGGYGGYFLGYPDQGQPPDQVVRGKSTSDNAVIFAAFQALALAATDDAERKDWQSRANAAADFVDAMFDAGTRSFYSGTTSISDLRNGVPVGVIPDGPQQGNDVVNIYDYADAQLLPILAMAGSSRTTRKPEDWQGALAWLGPMQRSLTPNSTTILKGINLATRPLQDSPDGIAWQYTAQAILAMRLVDSINSSPQFAATEASYLDSLRLAQIKADPNNPEANGSLPASTLDSPTKVQEACISVPFQCIPARPSLGATIWALFAEMNFNPLAPGSGK